ncbi:MAG: class II glutamine amidotransferase, partial [Rhodospirillaceae bacterium]|nr:class II glutamine amidotransferase [Rhodospirillaceae bacterium]
AAEVEAPLRLTATATDGEAIYAIRYASDDHAPSLYLGTARTNGEVSLTILSEPLTSVKEDWREVPRSHFVIAGDGAFTEEPFTPHG